MARIKPKDLLVQSKKKKSPSPINASTIIACNLILVLVVLSLLASYRPWSRRSRDRVGSGLSTLEEMNDHLADSKKYDLPSYAILNTSKGSVTVELYKDGAPEIVDKFLDLCQKGYFNAMPFHHVIKHYVVQAGHSKDLGAVEDWTTKGNLHSQLASSVKHEAFMLGTSKSKGASGFELFITTAPIPNLSDRIMVFGRVIKGEDVVQEIEEVDTDEYYQPTSFVGITNITLKREA